MNMAKWLDTELQLPYGKKTILNYTILFLILKPPS